MPTAAQGSEVDCEAFTCCSDPDQHRRRVKGPGVGMDEHGDVATRGKRERQNTQMKTSDCLIHTAGGAQVCGSC